MVGLTEDYRRHFRPFFLDPDLETPTEYKKYYDLLCYVVIQTTYNYVAMPFLILTIADSLKLWSRLYVKPLPPDSSDWVVLRPYRYCGIAVIFPQ